MIHDKNFKQEGGENSTNFQGGIINVYQTGSSNSDIEKIVKFIFIENFPKIQEIAKQEAEKNCKLFASELTKIIAEKLNVTEINKFNDPDIQFALKDAILTASRKNNPETRTILSNLIVDRVKNDGIDFKEIVYNEAVITISRLTKNHLDILAFTFIVRYAQFNNIISWDIFENTLKKYIYPFIEFQNSNAQFQHLEYADCAKLELASISLERIFQSFYNNLFYKEEKIIMNENEIATKLKEKLDLGNKLLEKFNHTSANRLSLTSVGIVIAVSYLEVVTKEKLNIDFWIN